MKPYIIALLVAVGVLAGFYGGYKVGQNNVSAASPAASSSQRTGTFGGGNRGNFAAACPSPGAPSPSPGTNAVARGTITDLTSGSLTITSPACDVKVVFGNTVQVSKTVPGSTGDLQDNITVTIIGTRQPDGSIKASTIQIGNFSAIAGGRGSGSGSGAGG